MKDQFDRAQDSLEKALVAQRTKAQALVGTAKFQELSAVSSWQGRVQENGFSRITTKVPRPKAMRPRDRARLEKFLASKAQTK